jgi:hypothetical protein
MFSNNYTVTSYLAVVHIIISLSFVSITLLLYRSMCLPCSDFTENTEMNVLQECEQKVIDDKAVITAAHRTVVLDLL